MLPDLTTAAGRQQLEHAISLVDADPDADPLQRAARLRGVLDPGLAAAALTQSALRARAYPKFGAAAATMLFTAPGLEQASRTEVAGHRASRFAAVGVPDLLDLCCGIGGDLRAFTEVGLAATGVERDPQTAGFAAANSPAATVRVGEAEDSGWQRASAVFIDPSRRTDGRRVFDPDAFSPPFKFVAEVLAGAPFAAAKLAPGLPHGLVPADVEAEWVSVNGGVKEAVLWSAAFTGRARRRATVLSSAAPVLPLPAGPALPLSAPPASAGRVTVTDLDAEAMTVAAIGAYLYEPDGAVIRAGLVRQVAALLPGGRRIDEHLAYLSADAPAWTGLARGFRVAEVLPFSVRALRRALGSRDVGIVEIKKRGVDIDPDVLRRQLKPSGSASITVLLARVGDERLAILAHPVGPEPG